jgi:phosphatidylserine/phosphatidylglycerophosphate/cardiolipin synthase-like enzyme
VGNAYVHAKLMVVDDRYAIVSSANGARRSFTFDSEACIGVFDRVPADRAIASFARRLRMRLWHENLEREAPDLSALADARAAAFYWDDIDRRGEGILTAQRWHLESWDHLVSRTTNPGAHAEDWEWDEVRDPTPPAPT